MGDSAYNYDSYVQLDVFSDCASMLSAISSAEAENHWVDAAPYKEKFLETKMPFGTCYFDKDEVDEFVNKFIEDPINYWPAQINFLYCMNSKDPFIDKVQSLKPIFQQTLLSEANEFITMAYENGWRKSDIERLEKAFVRKPFERFSITFFISNSENVWENSTSAMTTLDASKPFDLSKTYPPILYLLNMANRNVYKKNALLSHAPEHEHVHTDIRLKYWEAIRAKMRTDPAFIPPKNSTEFNRLSINHMAARINKDNVIIESDDLVDWLPQGSTIIWKPIYSQIPVYSLKEFSKLPHPACNLIEEIAVFSYCARKNEPGKKSALSLANSIYKQRDAGGFPLYYLMTAYALYRALNEHRKADEILAFANKLTISKAKNESIETALRKALELISWKNILMQSIHLLDDKYFDPNNKIDL